ncbi:ACP S-malonyltransferase [Silanimonas lenta]|uniref:ACP S-malonyltransferase n=1 Tax=Silanimonas lenta TaxID=265429 RepID=UPI00048FDB1E|nr:ACP S-malonyltransferase [Silanimonas lenta]
MAQALAFVFPGQGSQALGMVGELAARDAGVRATFDEASEGAGVDLWALSQEGPEERLNQTEFTQPALLAASVALWRLWLAAGGPRPVALAGHSLGEYSALVAADAIPLGDAARLVRLRGQLMQAAVPAGTGAMVAVLGAEDAVVEAACAEAAQGEVVVPANYNTPGQVVIGGHAAAVERAVALLAERGVRKTVRLAVSVPSHTPLMRRAADELAEAMRAVAWRTPALPVLRNVDAGLHSDVEALVDALVRQLYCPVQWTRCVQALAARGVGRLAECGPGKALAGMAKRIDRALEAKALGTPAEFDAALAEWSA